MKKIGIAAAVIVAIGILYAITMNATRHTVVATVTDKERVCGRANGDQVECQYLVFTDAGTFKVTDSWVLGRFTSSDTYGRIAVGKTYRFEVVGWRNGLLSQYPNIDTATEVSP